MRWMTPFGWAGVPFVLLACGPGSNDEDPSGAGGEGATDSAGGSGAGIAIGGGGAGASAGDGPGGSGPGGSGAGGSGASGGAGASGGQGGNGGTPIPCTPLNDGISPNPTAGSCDGNTAVTCGTDGFLTYETCGAGDECTTYELQEWQFSSASLAWVEGRVVDWAGCLPVDAPSCEMAWNGNYYEAVEQNHCDGKDKLACRTPPAPDLFSNSPQLVYGTTEGWLQIEPCPNGEKCAGSDTLGQLTCIDETTPACDGSEPFCSGNGIAYCHGTWESTPGYQAVTPCQGGDLCYEGTQGPFCNPPGSEPCDESTFETTCSASGSEIVSCYNGWTIVQDCSTCSDGTQQVPCRCDDKTTVSGWGGWGADAVCSENVNPACVPQANLDCDPDAGADYCDGDIAMRCTGTWEATDCGALGLICDTAAGRAGCREANAPTCETSNSTCDGTEIVACCACGSAGLFVFGPEAPPCVPGYEARTDCAEWSGYTCDEETIFTECVFEPEI